MSKNLTAISFLFHSAILLCLPAAAQWPDKKSEWHGFNRHDFTLAGRPCYVVVPPTPAEGNPWVWRARFPNYHSDIELVTGGFHIAHMDASGQFGSPSSLDDWDTFYELLTTKLGLAKKPALVAVSRVSLFAYHWASRHPENVACIYADVPVCYFKSWPLGRGQDVGGKETWVKLLQAYKLTPKQSLAWRENPVDVFKRIAAAKVPLMHIVAENDRVVPATEITDELATRYKALGGNITVTRVKAGTAKSKGHHFDMTPADIKRAVEFTAAQSGPAPDEKPEPTSATIEQATEYFLIVSDDLCQ